MLDAGLLIVLSVVGTCYISSLVKSKPLIQSILPDSSQFLEQPIVITENALVNSHHNLKKPIEENRSKQREWGNAVCESEFSDLISSAHQVALARLQHLPLTAVAGSKPSPYHS